MTNPTPETEPEHVVGLLASMAHFATRGIAEPHQGLALALLRQVMPGGPELSITSPAALAATLCAWDRALTAHQHPIASTQQHTLVA